MNRLIKNSNTLELIKWLSILSMLIDHIGYTFYDSNIIMRFIGRFAFIGFSFLIAYHYRFNTHDKTLYKKRIFLFALLSQYPFSLLFPHLINILFLLWYSLVILDNIELIIKEDKIVSPTLIISAGAILSYWSGYYFFGIFLIPLFYFLYLYEIALYLLILNVLFVNFTLIYALAGILSLYVILLSNISFKLKRINKYLFYWFYPLHLLILAIIKMSL